MRILIIGEWKWEIYEKSFASALADLDLEFIKFSYAKKNYQLIDKIFKKLFFLKFILSKTNNSIIKYSLLSKPDFILFWRPTNILPSTLNSLKKSGFVLISYNNDDPFNCKNNFLNPWKWYLKCLPFFDLNFFYRGLNCNEAEKYGSYKNYLLMPYYLPLIHYPKKLSKKDTTWLSGLCTRINTGGCKVVDGDSCSDFGAESYYFTKNGKLCIMGSM
jgi:hypothetical protein